MFAADLSEDVTRVLAVSQRPFAAIFDLIRAAVNATSAVAVTGCAQHFAEATANPPFLLDLGPVERGTTVDDVQRATSCRAFRRLNESSSDRLIAPGRWWIHHRGMLFFVRDGSLMDHPRRELAWR